MEIFHIAEPDEWASRDDTYFPVGLAAEGFIHCSTQAQLAEVAARFYPDRDDLVLLTIETEAVSAILRFEDFDDAGEGFPHIYGPIALEAVTSHRDFSTV